MKKVLIATTAFLCFVGQPFAQENAGGSVAVESATGSLNKEKIIAGAVGVGILAGMIANNRGTSLVDPVDPVDPVCDAGEELIDGECVPVTTTTTVTTTLTSTLTSTVTTSITVTSTSL